MDIIALISGCTLSSPVERTTRLRLDANQGSGQAQHGGPREETPAPAAQTLRDDQLSKAQEATWGLQSALQANVEPDPAEPFARPDAKKAARTLCGGAKLTPS